MCRESAVSLQLHYDIITSHAVSVLVVMFWMMIILIACHFCVLYLDIRNYIS